IFTQGSLRFTLGFMLPPASQAGPQSNIFTQGSLRFTLGFMLPPASQAARVSKRLLANEMAQWASR
ncbi:MAG: hypothetical protein ACRD6N_04625, partial [Pyrinomonadaceae bacterium]